MILIYYIPLIFIGKRTTMKTLLKWWNAIIAFFKKVFGIKNDEVVIPSIPTEEEEPKDEPIEEPKEEEEQEEPKEEETPPTENNEDDEEFKCPDYKISHKQNGDVYTFTVDIEK